MITKLAEDLDLKYKMQDNYYASTKKHLSGVFKYIDKIVKLDPAKYGALTPRKLIYDASKNAEPEFTPYCVMLWKEKNKDYKVPAPMSDDIKAAVLHHWKNNRHHPEFHDNKLKLKNVTEDSDDIPPNIVIDATPMTDLDLAEMTADWCAMADDAGISGKKWADDHIGKHYKFSKDQVDMIYDFIRKIV
jgi:hypothetical protein